MERTTRSRIRQAPHQAARSSKADISPFVVDEVALTRAEIVQARTSDVMIVSVR